MSDLLAKCDWDGDELRVELPQWPEVMTVWVNGKAMPYVPVVNDSKCDTCDAMLDCDECVRADVSHKELRGLQAENDRLRVELTDLRLKSCPSCGIKVENEKLRNENARMRSCLSDDVDNARQIMGENKKLREQGERLFDKTLELGTENAKLRELCRHLYACNQYCDRENSGGGCSACPYQPLECDCGFEERLLELGIEVEL